MAFSIEQKALAQLVNVASKICKKKSPIAIVECIKINFGGESLSIEATVRHRMSCDSAVRAVVEKESKHDSH